MTKQFFLAVAAMVGVVTLGVLYGILVAVLLSLANFIRKVRGPDGEAVMLDALLGSVVASP